PVPDGVVVAPEAGQGERLVHDGDGEPFRLRVARPEPLDHVVDQPLVDLQRLRVVALLQRRGAVPDAGDERIGRVRGDGEEQREENPGEHYAVLRIIRSPITSRSIFVRRKQSSAWAGVFTTGSFSLNDVFNTTGTPVASRNASIRW